MSRAARSAAAPPLRRASATNSSPTIRSRTSSTSSTATVTPTSTPPSTTTIPAPVTLPPVTPTRQNMSFEQAKKDLIERKLIPNTNSVSLHNLVNILLGFTGREESADGLGEPWEIVVAVGVILEKEMVRLAAEATADATATRMQSLLEAAREEARKEVAGKKEMLDKIEDALDEREARVRETENKAEEEREEVATSKFELEGEKKKLLEDALKVDGLISRLGEVVERSEKERKEWEEIRKEGRGGEIGASVAPTAPATNDKPWNGTWGDSELGPDFGMGWGYQGDGFRSDTRGPAGSYADATARGGSQGMVAQALSEQDLARGRERMQRGEEKREHQLLLDADVVAGEKGLKGLTEKDLLNRATKVVEGMIEVELLEGKPAGLDFVKATTQNNGGVLYELNTKEVRNWLARPDMCNKFTDEFGFGAKVRERKFPVLVEFVPIGIDISKRATIETIETDNELEKGTILGAKWVRNPAMREPGQRHAHLIINCRTKEHMNEWIAGLRSIGGKDCTSVKLLPEPLRCYNCQLPGHQANKCLSPQVCGTCGGQHRTDKCTNRLNVYCVMCKEKGSHPTWSPSCPGYVTRCMNLSDRIPDNRYRFYVTSEDWTWELLTNETYRRRMRIPNSRRPLAPTPAQDSPATGANTINLNPNREHPHPENLARPAHRGSVLSSRQTQITEFTNAPGTSGNAQPTQPLVPSPTTNA